ncbi:MULTISPECIES: MalY/PatB family protein [Clostridium]|uniref:MalY/PatB family protein n=2 Tax=Bacillota TaxID=1239 RepID=UPI0006668ED3|nr:MULTISPECIES: MalY/PatB family protein [Clostridium]MBS7131538.1 pyridoxal phosphate-dependent aminotransferase [Clostridium sp.]MDB2074829.1 pyridoxal phosphate-dependent aminotransferase [Clostridium paraputrificum]MDB2080259.1 pyridoxal phosphate-dependent aminotransferase [Clostridium paraputrificum]MDB2093740.1 pyridoxal phosphate-dependent aminotransferase [Clostridium paraputrificum]MDB2101151.1 pyridoxal phosphate-dependent aminotransferase [Clostridium paraputrificum]
MQYNFSKLTNRFNTNSLKWDVNNNELPMWVADMDFETAPEIREAIRKKVDFGIYGYTIIPDEYYLSISNWWERRHNFKIEKEWILFCTGVVPAISSIVRKMTREGDNVLVQAPVYNIFYNSIVNNNRKVLSSDLCFDGKEYSIDYEDLERKLSDPATTLMILCNPHNPIGKVWSKETLKKIGELCIKYNVLVVSDEIHCDLTYGNSYTPFASISPEIAQNSITCIAPTKTFNLAGVQSSNIIVPNDEIRRMVNRGINTDEVAEPNAFAIEATIAAFTKGEPWLNELIEYLAENKRVVQKFIHNELPSLNLIHSDATYLLWIDCSSITKDSLEFCKFIRKETGLYVSSGHVYGSNGGHFIRMNIACQRERVEDGLSRLKVGVDKYIKRNII